MNTFKLKKGDTMPPLAVTMQYANGSSIDLTGGSVFFNMGNTLNYSAFYSGLATITGSTTGDVQYNWTGSETSTAGTYFGEFEFIIGGSRLTLPTDHSLKIQISEDYT